LQGEVVEDARVVVACEDVVLGCCGCRGEVWDFGEGAAVGRNRVKAGDHQTAHVGGVEGVLAGIVDELGYREGRLVGTGALRQDEACLGHEAEAEGKCDAIERLHLV
jgi:hypothetical protein